MVYRSGVTQTIRIRQTLPLAKMADNTEGGKNSLGGLETCTISWENEEALDNRVIQSASAQLYNPSPFWPLSHHERMFFFISMTT